MTDTSALRVVAVHQPNFFPWLGYFHKMRWSSTFVLLDDAMIQKTGGSVTNRTSLAPAGKSIWVSAPIDRSFSGMPRIDQVRFSEREPFRDRLLATLRSTYGRAPFFTQLWDAVTALVVNPEPLLATYNTHAIRVIAGMLGLDAEIVLSSSLGVDATSTDRLVELVNRVSGNTYLYGGGAKNYQDDSSFLRRGINLSEQRFSAPTYSRGSHAAIAGLSVLDALFFLGPDGTRALLETPPPSDGLRLAIVRVES